MYYWRIDSLKRELATKVFTDERVLPYFFWLGGITTAIISLPAAEANRWDVTNSFVSVILFLAGSWYAFLCNGASSGTQFFARYFTLAWVLSVRFAVMSAVPFIAVIVLFSSPDSMDSTPGSAAVSVVVECLYYWRLCVHMRYVASTST
jgi:hypothetical protein